MISQKTVARKSLPLSEQLRHSRAPRSCTIEDAVLRNSARRLLMRGGNGRCRDHQDASEKDDMRSSVWAVRKHIKRILDTVIKNIIAMKKHDKSKTVRPRDVKAAFKVAYKLNLVG